MTMFKSKATTKVAAMALLALCAAAPARAEDTATTAPGVTVQTNRTEWVRRDEPAYPAKANMLDLSKLDANGDGILTKEEVGLALFGIFDTDGNKLVDNVEFEKKKVTTFVPMKETETVSWYSGDNTVPDKTIVSRSEFLKASQLARFDAAGDGLSPHDFAGKSFDDADVNHDHFVDLKEWQGAYNAAINAENQKQQQFSTNK